MNGSALPAEAVGERAVAPGEDDRGAVHGLGAGAAWDCGGPEMSAKSGPIECVMLLFRGGNLALGESVAL